MRSNFTRVVRDQAYRRANGACQKCLRPVFKGEYHVDHIIADSIGGKATLANAQILCNECHNWKTRKADVPRIAKTKRQKRKHDGTWRASRHPVPGSRLSKWRKPLRGKAELRP